MKKILITAILLTGTMAFSQKHDLGKVTVEELKEKTFAADTSAAAAILFNVGEVKFDYSDSNGFTMATKVKTKIKIYKKEGYDWANKAVAYYIGGSSKERVSFDNAATYNLIDGKVVKSKLKGDGEFDEKVNKFWGRKKITLPNVKEGSIIEFEYTLSSDNFGSLEDWYFQYEIPVLYSEFKTSIPEYYIYKPLMKGFFNPTTVSEKNSKTISITSKDRSDGLVTKTTFSVDQLNYFETKSVYTLTNLPALKDESFVNNIKNYTASIEHELTSIHFPNTPYKNYSTDWETVVKKIYDNEDFGAELNKTGYFEKDIDALLAEVNSQDQRIGIIFSYVKSRMNWNEFHSYSCDVGVRKAYQDKVGNVAEINLMLTAMLRYAGIEANPILVSTRSNGISLFPSRTSFNYVIAGIEINDQIVLLDATNKYSIPNILPIRDLNWFGRLIRKNGSSLEIDLMPKYSSKGIINMMGAINEKGEVTGKVRNQQFDYNAFLFRQNNNNVAKDSYIEKLEKRYQGVEIGAYEVQNNNDLGQPIIENYDFTSTNSVEIIGDKMYLSPLIFFAMTENPFKQETREYPIDFVYPNQDKYNLNLTIPEGYAVETLPLPKAVAMPDNLASFKYNISNSGNKIQLQYTQDINQAIISSEYYEELKAFYKEIISKQTEKIVLKKV
jgi:hypothetical protein